MSRSELAVFAAMTALSGALAVLGAPIGFVGLLFFGGGGVVYWYLHREPDARQRSGADPGTLAGAERHTALAEGEVFREDRRALAAAAAGAATFVVLGVYLIVASRAALEQGERFAGRSPISPLVAGILAVAVFGTFLVFLSLAVLRPGGVALLPEGVYVRQPAGTAWLPWGSIEEVSVVHLLGQPFVGLRGTEGAPIELTGWTRLLRGWHRRRLGIDVGYSPRASASSSRDLCEAIERHLRESHRAGVRS